MTSQEQSYVTLQLRQAWTMPAEVDVDDIAERSLQAAFRVIADLLALEGYPVTGDFTPHEVAQMDRAFKTFVWAMALNNPTISEMQEGE